jgi:hypothetical protein
MKFKYRELVYLDRLLKEKIESNTFFPTDLEIELYSKINLERKLKETEHINN